ncbi:MAG TPA: hypothetical protein VD713_04010 [Sphingomonadales bacterium]|nr:hypothetical protein [Sphingomonadales bacterium]
MRARHKLIVLFLLSLVSFKTFAAERDLEEAISHSDDFGRYKAAFLKATQDLIQSKKCSISDFEEMGGWVKSTTTYNDEPVYFIYCGGLAVTNRIYLDVSSGKIFH